MKKLIAYTLFSVMTSVAQAENSLEKAVCKENPSACGGSSNVSPSPTTSQSSQGYRCDAGLFHADVKKLITRMDARIEDIVRKKMNSTVINGQTLGYQEGSFRVSSGSLSYKAREPNWSYGSQDNNYTFKSAAGDEYALIYFDINGGRRMTWGWSFDVQDISLTVQVATGKYDVNTNALNCHLSTWLNTRANTLMIVNKRTNLGYFLREEDGAKGGVSLVVPAR